MYKIKNNPGEELPKTGGSGTALYNLYGGLLMVGAALAIAIADRRRKQSA